MISSYENEDKFLNAVDCIIFGFDGDNLKILLIKRGFEPEKGKWSLMGGFLKKNENFSEAAARVLNKLTGLHDVYLEQLFAYSKVDRDPVERILSIAYYTLIDINTHNKELIQKNSAKWFDVVDFPKLIFDHKIMVERAIKRLRRKTSIEPIGFKLLPRKFTMLQLHNLYQTILNKKIDKRNFITKINSLNILIKLHEKNFESSKKGSFLYMFDKEEYEEKLSNGFSFKL
ncbi:MAG: NUDIX domain-containing protein [Flavobacteriaceae bacterium]|nr:NUDIX domain-containing protein [Flavobacteriaceae bacterium]